MQDDSVTYDSFVGFGFNRYAYCMYNPLKYVDPTGERYFGWSGGTYEVHVTRGMYINFGDGNTYITTARDIGNVYAGFIAEYHGLTYDITRKAFDSYNGQPEPPVSIESHNKRTEQLLAMLPENMNINNMTDNVKTVIKDSNSMQIVCCPNPTNETLTLSYILEFDTNVDISIYGILGNRLKYINLGKQNGGSQSCNIDVSDLHSGIYFCNIQTNDGIIKSIKIVVEH